MPHLWQLMVSLPTRFISHGSWQPAALISCCAFVCFRTKDINILWSWTFLSYRVKKTASSPESKIRFSYIFLLHYQKMAFWKAKRDNILYQIFASPECSLCTHCSPLLCCQITTFLPMLDPEHQRGLQAKVSSLWVT